MNKHKLILHIGASKTGTSSLQNFLYENETVLKKYGYCYPDLCTELENIGCLVNIEIDQRTKNGSVFHKFIDNRNGKMEPKIESKEWEKLWNIIRVHLQDYDVIISEETLFRLEAIEILKCIKSQYDNIEVIAYIRRQDRFLESYWNQTVKRYGYCDCTFEEYVKNVYREWPAYLQELNNVENVFGFENVRVRVYEKEQFCGSSKDIISDFMFYLGIDLTSENVIKVKNTNQSLSRNMIEIKRNMNTILKRGGYEGAEVERLFLETVRKISGEGRTDKNRGVDAYFSSKERCEIIQYYVEENAIIAKKYLKRNDEQLFCGEIEKSLPCEIDNETLLGDVIKVFTSMVIEQQKRIQRLENNRIYDLLKNDGRPVCFFGAGNMCKDIMKIYGELPIEYIFDNSPTAWGKTINGIEVCNPQVCKKWKEYYIVVACRETQEIEEQLQGYGLKKYMDYILAKEYIG